VFEDEISVDAEIVVFLDGLRANLSSELSLTVFVVFLTVDDSVALTFLLLEISRSEISLSLDIDLFLTRGDFCASSWLAFRRLADAAIAESWIFSVPVLEYDCDDTTFEDDASCEDNAEEDIMFFSSEEAIAIIVLEEDDWCNTVPLSTTPRATGVSMRFIMFSLRDLASTISEVREAEVECFLIEDISTLLLFSIVDV